MPLTHAPGEAQVDEAVPASDHTHHFKALDGRGSCCHRLKASGGSDDALKGAMVGFDEVVQIFAGPMSCVGRQLALALKPVNWALLH